MARKYERPPIVEAICEFKFDPESRWDLTIPGLLYENLKYEFPNKGSNLIMGFNIAASPEEIKQNVEKIELAQFKHQNKPLLVQVGQHILTINHLAPYSNWENFIVVIEKAYNAYKQVANPSAFQRIGVRYINRIDIPRDKFRFKLFTFGPKFWSPVPQPNSVLSFITGVELPFEGNRDRMKLQLATAQTTQTDMRSFILDIDYYLTDPSLIGFDDAIKWVNDAHKSVEKAFEDSISDKLREQFGAG